LIEIIDAVVDIMYSPTGSLKNHMREKGSVNALDAHIYLLGCGHDINYDMTKSILKGLCEEGFARHSGCHDTHGAPVYEIIE